MHLTPASFHPIVWVGASAEAWGGKDSVCAEGCAWFVRIRLINKPALWYFHLSGSLDLPAVVKWCQMSLYVGWMLMAKSAGRGRYFKDIWNWLKNPIWFWIYIRDFSSPELSTLRASIASATSNSLSVSWLLLPYGGLPARASLYLNERASVSSTLIEEAVVARCLEKFCSFGSFGVQFSAALHEGILFAASTDGCLASSLPTSGQEDSQMISFNSTYLKFKL